MPKLLHNDTEEPSPSTEMVNLVDYCSTYKYRLIMGCDANAHHICWGSTDINQRGGALLEYLVTTDPDILNRGTICKDKKLLI